MRRKGPNLAGPNVWTGVKVIPPKSPPRKIARCPSVVGGPPFLFTVSNVCPILFLRARWANIIPRGT